MLICLRLVVRLMSESALPRCAACDDAGSATYVRKRPGFSPAHVCLFSPAVHYFYYIFRFIII